MSKEAWISRSFGVRDKPRCAYCGEQTFLSRRAPAADYAREYEQQTFTCLKCNKNFERVVDANGTPVSDLALG